MSRRSARVDKASEIEALAREHLCRAFPDLLALYLYGSFAGDESWPSSDVDLGLLLAGGRSADPERLLETAADLGARFHRDVDLVDLRAAGTDLPKEVLQKGRAVYVGDREAVLAWEATVLSDYGRLNAERKDIMDDFRRTGIGYGA